MRTAAFLIFASLACTAAEHQFTIPSELTGTAPLHLSPDWREQQRQEILRYLDARIARAQTARDVIWKPALKSPQIFVRTAGHQRNELRKMLGVEDHTGASASMARLQGGISELVVT